MQIHYKCTYNIDKYNRKNEIYLKKLYTYTTNGCNHIIDIDLHVEKSFKKTYCQLGRVFILNKWKR